MNILKYFGIRKKRLEQDTHSNNQNLFAAGIQGAKNIFMPTPQIAQQRRDTVKNVIQDPKFMLGITKTTQPYTLTQAGRRYTGSKSLYPPQYIRMPEAFVNPLYPYTSTRTKVEKFVKQTVPLVKVSTEWVDPQVALGRVRAAYDPGYNEISIDKSMYMKPKSSASYDKNTHAYYTTMAHELMHSKELNAAGNNPYNFLGSNPLGLTKASASELGPKGYLEPVGEYQPSLVNYYYDNPGKMQKELPTTFKDVDKYFSGKQTSSLNTYQDPRYTDKKGTGPIYEETIPPRKNLFGKTKETYQTYTRLPPMYGGSS